MAVTAYIRLNTDKLGKIKGGATQKGHEGDIEIIAADHGISSPRDLATGKASGKRQHRFMNILKEVDVCSPVLNRMIVENISISVAELFFYGPASQSRFGTSGTEKNFYTITLRNAFIISLELNMRNNKETEGNFIPLVETMKMVYESIEWKWLDGNISATDQWNLP